MRDKDGLDQFSPLAFFVPPKQKPSFASLTHHSFLELRYQGRKRALPMILESSCQYG